MYNRRSEQDFYKINQPKNNSVLDIKSFQGSEKSTYTQSVYLASDSKLSDQLQSRLSTQNDKNEDRLKNRTKFMEEMDWKQNQENCYVCERKFDKLKGLYTHHCRICGNAACGECSKKRIEQKRVCDICYTKERRKNVVDQQKKLILTYQKSISDLKKQLESNKKESSDLDKAYQDIERDMKDEEDLRIKSLSKLNENLQAKRNEYSKKAENNVRLKQYSESEKELALEKVRDLEKLEKHLAQVKSDLAHKQAIYDIKLSELRKLQEQKEVLLNK